MVFTNIPPRWGAGRRVTNLNAKSQPIATENAWKLVNLWLQRSLMLVKRNATKDVSVGSRGA